MFVDNKTENKTKNKFSTFLVARSTLFAYKMCMTQTSHIFFIFFRSQPYEMLTMIRFGNFFIQQKINEKNIFFFEFFFRHYIRYHNENRWPEWQRRSRHSNLFLGFDCKICQFVLSVVFLRLVLTKSEQTR